MQSRPLIAALGLLALGGVAWFALGSGPSSDVATTLVSTGGPEIVQAGEADDDLVDLGDVTPAAVTIRESVALEAQAAEAVEAEHPWSGMLAGLTGRLVEKDGTPVPSMRVELIEADSSVLFGAEHAALGTTELEIGEVFTNAEGQFLFEGARDGSFHALNIDRGGGRATIRLVEQSVEIGALTDLGDIVMDEYGTLFGTVIDEDGEPVAGARVRATAMPDIVVQSGILDVREGIVLTGGGEDVAFQPPASAFALFDRLPVPTTMTDAEGAFRLEGVPLGMVSGGVDLPGHIAAKIGPISMTATEVDVGELELLFGRTVTGTVTDLEGEPVSGISVCAGALHPLFNVAIMQSGGVSNEAGEFVVKGVPEDGAVVGAMRRHRSESWTLAKAEGGSARIDFVVPSAGKVLCTVVDEEDQPVTGAEVTLRLSLEEGNEMSWMMNLALAGRKPMEKTKARATATPGVYMVEDLSLGKWMVEARVPGRAIVREEVEHKGGETLVRLVSPKGQMLRVTVTDAVTGEVVPKAHATLLGPEGFLFTAFASNFTAQDGTTSLGPLGPEWREDAMSGAVWLKETVVSVEHPLYGMAKVSVPEGATEVAVALPPTCTVEGAVTWGGGSPGNVYMVMLRWNDDSDAMAQAMMLPRTALTNLEGRFKVTGLAPGEYEVYLMERYFEGNPLQIFVDQKEPTMVDQTKVVADPEVPSELLFELSPDGMGPSGAFAGRVTVEDEPVSGAEIRVGRRDPEVYYTDAGGYFETEPYPVINGQRVVIMADVPTANGSVERQEVFNAWRRPKRDEVTEINVELSYTPIMIQVVDARTGMGVPDVSVRLSGGGNWRGRRGGNKMTTDGRGEAMTVLPDKKEYTITATSDLYARASVKVSAGSVKDDGIVKIEMQMEVPCAGTILLPEEAIANGKMYLNVTAPGFEGDWSPIDPDDMSFTLKRMAPGEYNARIWSGPQTGMVNTSFVLPEGGDTALLLEFSSEENSD